MGNMGVCSVDYSGGCDLAFGSMDCVWVVLRLGRVDRVNGCVRDQLETFWICFG